MAKENCKQPFDVKLFLSIFLPLLALALAAENRMTKVESRIESLQSDLVVIAGIQQDVVNLKIRISACEKIVGFNLDGSFIVYVDPKCESCGG